ncbi:MAG: hypothetical protein GKR87_05305 [Kiritimatiellae bacterium]|nr:hypothetical protein [Kiritimatiellia bacterium]
MTTNNEYIIEILENAGLILQEQGVRVMSVADTEDGDVIDILVRDEGIHKMDILKALANQFGMETIDLSDVDISQDILQLVPGDVAIRYKIIPVSETDGLLTVALSDPLDVETLDSLRYILKRNVEGVVADSKKIDQALSHYYAGSTSSIMESVLEEITDAAGGLVTVDGVSLDSSEEVSESDTPIIKLASLIIFEAFRNRASDVHIEPLAKKLRVRYRIDGVLQEVDRALHDRGVAM